MKDFLIVDFHAHIFPDKVAEKASRSIGSYYNIPMMYDGTVYNLLQSGSKINTKKYVVHSTATRPDQVRAINQFISDQCKIYTNFIGFGTLHPDMDNFGSEIDFILNHGLKGIKLHPEFQKFSLDSKRVIQMVKFIDDLPLLMHMGDEHTDTSSPRRLAALIDSCPKTKVVAAHFGGYQAWDESVKHLIGRENLYFDTSSSLKFLSSEKATEIIYRHGPDKILFGVDYPMWDHQQELTRFMNLELTDEDRSMILGLNAVNLLSFSY